MSSLDELDLESLDFRAITPPEVARLVKDVLKGSNKRDLAQLVAGPARPRIAEEVFSRMEDQFKPESAGRMKALIRWVISDASLPDLVYETDIADGTLTLHKGATEQTPRLTLTMASIDFLRLVSGNASGTTMFMTRKLKASGDLGLATSLTRFFDIPKA